MSMRILRPLSVSLLVALTPLSCSPDLDPEGKHKVVIIGVDGMDYRLARQFMDQGLLPNLKALAGEGDFRALGTSIPPESPVAWSNFITGRNPGGHGIFDFLQPEWKVGEDGEAFLAPVDSIAGMEDVGAVLRMFGYAFPLSGGESYNKRRGTPFWVHLERAGVPATVFKIPANYPPTETAQRTMSGMGTPDVQGGYGRYFVYTDDPLAVSDRIQAGMVRTVAIYDGTIQDYLYGPPNFLKDVPEGEVPEDVRVPMRIDIDPEEPIVRILVGEDESDNSKSIVLREGEWSDFVEVDFELLPYLVTVTGIARFHVQEVRPTFRMFVDPINISPLAPAFDITTPSDWAEELAKKVRVFETKGMPENTKALEEGAISDDEFRVHSILVYEKRKEILFKLLDEHQGGLLFHYFSSIDLDSHMFWRNMDPEHPGRPERVSEENQGFLRWLYQDIDQAIGRVREKLGPDDTLIVMSDHGFSPFYRAFNVNTWLRDKGYLVLKEGADPGVEGFDKVDWSETRAYNLGFAGIYLNLKGRDPMGCVLPSEADRLVDEICDRLMMERDPKTGEPVMATMYKAREVYSGEARDLAPDIVLGFRRTFRNAEESALGKLADEVLRDNLDPWSGCHMMAAEEVPGVLFTNRKVSKDDPKLFDLTATILAEYGIPIPEDMDGRPLWAPLSVP